MSRWNSVIWTLFDRDWNTDGEHEEVEGEVAVFQFPYINGEGPVDALSRWCKAIDGDGEWLDTPEGFGYSDAHTGTYEIVGEDEPLQHLQVTVRHLRSEKRPNDRLLNSVYQLRSASGTAEVTVNPWGGVVKEVAA
ncbi:MAG: hypothetical protein ACYS0D_16550 [Planctomycetota bacterium]|jgi:hypothetical protein